jgi:hypothetical protein
MVTFQPISFGESTATVIIENDGTTGMRTVTLRGMGVNPNVPQRGKIEYQEPAVVP